MILKNGDETEISPRAHFHSFKTFLIPLTSLLHRGSTSNICFKSTQFFPLEATTVTSTSTTTQTTTTTRVNSTIFHEPITNEAPYLQGLDFQTRNSNRKLVARQTKLQRNPSFSSFWRLCVSNLEGKCELAQNSNPTEKELPTTTGSRELSCTQEESGVGGRGGGGVG